MDNLKGKVGCIIGRFQTPYLHEGHIDLIERVFNMHSNVVIFLGVSRIQNTKRNPLDFATRRKLILESFPDAIVMPLLDNRSDEKWSKQVDDTLASIFPETPVILYGNRDSFIPHYSGIHKTEYLDNIEGFSATSIREKIANESLDSKDFRSGVIYGIYKQRDVTYPTVDIVVVNSKKQILLARKPSENKFRFVGGFVDTTDDSYEAAARRELLEETQLTGLKATYITSAKIPDWRYKKENSGIMTSLFMFREWDQMGTPKASDDISEVKYFDLNDLVEYEKEPSLGDGHIPRVNYTWKLEDKIVPEHIELMKKFINKIVDENLL
jgi:bifunctional NMN adenylyltransferase/nudix hydrolase